MTRRHYGEDWVDVNETLRKIQEDIRLEKQPTNVPDLKSIAAQSSTPQMTSIGAFPSAGQHLSHEANPHAESSSRNAMHIGEIPPKTTFHPRNVVYDDVHQPLLTQEMERPWVIVNSPPRLPTNT